MSIPIKSIVASAVNTIWDLTADIKVLGTYHRLTPGAYNPTTGAAAVTDTTYPVDYREAVFKQRDIDGERIRAGDKKILVRVSEMSARPTADDYIVASDGRRWDLMQIETEPTGKILIFRGRAHAL